MNMPGDPHDNPVKLPTQTHAAINGVLVPEQWYNDVQEALTAADSILSLLHHRGVVVKNQFMKDRVAGRVVGQDAQDVKDALDKVVALSRSKPAVVRSAFFQPG